MAGVAFHQNIGATFDAVRRGEHVIVTIHGRPRCAIVSAGDYEDLVEARRHLGALRERAAHEAAVVTERTVRR